MSDLLKLANICNMKQDKAIEIINQVSIAIEKWHSFASHTGVSALQTKNIQKTLSTLRKDAGI